MISCPLRWPPLIPANAAMVSATLELTLPAFASIADGESCVKPRPSRLVVSLPRIENLRIGVTRWDRVLQTMAQPLWAIQVRPLTNLTFVDDADIIGGGLHIPITGFVGSVDEGPAIVGLDGIFRNLLGASNGSSLWTPTTDGGNKAISVPQRGKETGTLNTWFLNLCCLQGTLGQIAQQIYSNSILIPFQSNLFPKLQKTPYSVSTDNLGAWQMELRPADGAFTLLEALEYRAAIIAELDTWYLALIRQDPGVSTPQVVWPIPGQLALGTGLVYSPFLSLLPPSIYPPGGEQCDRQNRRPRRPFPPGSCAPPGSDCCNGGYFPIRNYPGCCFTRTNFPLAR